MAAFGLDVGTCGCCRPPSPGTPEPIHNRPGLDEVAYRVGTFASFRRAAITLVPRMGDELAAELGLAAPPLGRWTSEQPDDYGVALIELWATVADVLTFYQERYANRAWLRTAPERDAVRMLARLVGYRLRPGAAATTHLAYRIDPGARVTIPAGTRAQSVPDEGQQPQKFETAAPLEVAAAANRVPVRGQPRLADQLGPGRRWGTLDPASPVPVAGDGLVLVDPGTASQEVAVASTAVVDGRAVLRWSRPLAAGFDRAFLAGRRFRLFGHAAPPTHLVATPSGTGSFLTWAEQDTPRTIAGQSTLHLEGAVEGLVPGTLVLVQDPSGTTAGVRRVTALAAGTHTVGPLTGVATRVELDGTVSGAVDTMTVLELGDELTFDTWEWPDDPIPPTDRIHVAAGDLDTPDPGRLLVLDDDRSDPMVVEVERAEPAGPVTGTEALAITLTRATTRDLDPASAHLLGNVVAASHGETVAGEILGDGDRSAARQEFRLRKGPVTHVPDPAAPGGVRSTARVLVDGILWSERAALFGAGAGDRVYETAVDDDGRLRVRFGDGRQGARLPTGRANVVATYRHGLGAAGNLRAGQIRTALDRPVGVAAVTNPRPAAGGVEPETTAEARANAPNRVRTFDRAVSLPDFADLAREHAGVAKAHATWVWDREERTVFLTVGGAGGAPVADLGALRAYLDLRRDPNRALRLGEYRPVPFVVAVAVDVAADRLRDDVAEAVRAAVAGSFAFDARRFAQAVHLSDVYAVAQAVPGVVSVLVTGCRYRDAADFARHGTPVQPVLVHAPVHGARHHPPTGAIVPAELARLDPGDLTVSATGGIVL